MSNVFNFDCVLFVCFLAFVKHLRVLQFLALYKKHITLQLHYINSGCLPYYHYHFNCDTLITNILSLMYLYLDSSFFQEVLQLSHFRVGEYGHMFYLLFRNICVAI